MKINSHVYLIKVSKGQDPKTGYLVKEIAAIRGLPAEKQIIGMSTFWSGQAQSIVLNQAFVIKNRLYDRERWLYSNGELFEIVAPSKGKRVSEMRLNCRLINDPSLIKKIEERVKNGQS